MTASYLYGPRGPECRTDALGNAIWFMYDGHGNAVGEVTEDGKVNADDGETTTLRDYDPWGNMTTPPENLGPPASLLQYCATLGHPTEDNTGLIYMRARYYDPALGRFISEDPACDGDNWFAYAGGNPVGMVDRDGSTTLPEEVTTAQAEAEVEAGAGSTINIGDVLRTNKIFRGDSKATTNFIVKRINRLADQEGVAASGNLRRAAGKSIELFKKGCGMSPADNIGFSSNGLFVVDANNTVIGFVSHILYEMFL